MSKDAVGRVAECVDEALNESLLEQAAAIDEKIKTLQIELIGYRADSPDADEGTPSSRYGLEVFFAIVPLPAADDGSVGAMVCLYRSFLSMMMSSVLYSSTNPFFRNIVIAGLSIAISSYSTFTPFFLAALHSRSNPMLP